MVPAADRGAPRPRFVPGIAKSRPGGPALRDSRGEGLLAVGADRVDGDRPAVHVVVGLPSVGSPRVVVDRAAAAGDAAGGPSIPTDQFSLNYAKIEFKYRPQKDDQSLDSAVEMKWDVKGTSKA